MCFIFLLLAKALRKKKPRIGISSRAHPAPSRKACRADRQELEEHSHESLPTSLGGPGLSTQIETPGFRCSRSFRADDAILGPEAVLLRLNSTTSPWSTGTAEHCETLPGSLCQHGEHPPQNTKCPHQGPLQPSPPVLSGFKEHRST